MKFYSDSMHGWLAVKRNLLKDLNILDKISSYSYQKGKTVYLEEDRDYSLFVSAYNKRFYRYPDITTVEQTEKPHRIRGYKSFVLHWSERPPSPLFNELSSAFATIGDT